MRSRPYSSALSVALGEVLQDLYRTENVTNACRFKEKN